MERLIVFFAVALAMMAVAKWKGFSPWRWIFAAGLLGLVILLFLPSARAEGIDEEERVRRRQRGDKVGGVFSAIVLIILFPVMLFIADATGNEDLFVATLLIFFVVAVITFVAWLVRRKQRRERPTTTSAAGEAPSAVGPGEWHTIRDYSRLFNDARGVNFQTGVAFALAKVAGDMVSRHFLLGEAFVSIADLVGDLVFALVLGALFVAVSQSIKKTWAVPLIWGAVMALMGFLIRSGTGLLQAYFGYSGMRVLVLDFIYGALLMAGLVGAVRFWGPTLLSLITGAVVSAIPGVVIAVTAMHVPLQHLGSALIGRALLGLLLYLGLRSYFTKPVPPLATTAATEVALPRPTVATDAAMPAKGRSRIKEVKVVIESDMLSLFGTAMIVPPATIVEDVDLELASNGLIMPGEFSDYVSAHGLGNPDVVGTMTDAARVAMFQTLFPNDKWVCSGRVTETNHRYNIVVAFR